MDLPPTPEWRAIDYGRQPLQAEASGLLRTTEGRGVGQGENYCREKLRLGIVSVSTKLHLSVRQTYQVSAGKARAKRVIRSR